MDIRLRTSILGGYNKKDVAECIEALQNEIDNYNNIDTNKLQAKAAQNEMLNAELLALKGRLETYNSLIANANEQATTANNLLEQKSAVLEVLRLEHATLSQKYAASEEKVSKLRKKYLAIQESVITSYADDNLFKAAENVDKENNQKISAINKITVDVDAINTYLQKTCSQLNYNLSNLYKLVENTEVKQFIKNASKHSATLPVLPQNESVRKKIYVSRKKMRTEFNKIIPLHKKGETSTIIVQVPNVMQEEIKITHIDKELSKIVKEESGILDKDVKERCVSAKKSNENC